MQEYAPCFCSRNLAKSSLSSRLCALSFRKITSPGFARRDRIRMIQRDARHPGNPGRQPVSGRGAGFVRTTVILGLVASQRYQPRFCLGCNRRLLTRSRPIIKRRQWAIGQRPPHTALNRRPSLCPTVKNEGFSRYASGICARSTRRAASLEAHGKLRGRNSGAFSAPPTILCMERARSDQHA